MRRKRFVRYERKWYWPSFYVRKINSGIIRLIDFQLSINYTRGRDRKVKTPRQLVLEYKKYFYEKFKKKTETFLRSEVLVCFFDLITSIEAWNMAHYNSHLL